MPSTPRRPVGIEKIFAYPCTQYVDLREVAEVRGRDPKEIEESFLVKTRSVNPLWEDAVTMAVNAAQGVISPEDRERIELVIVATETSVDQGKPMSTYLQSFLELSPHTRNYESKGACNAGTSAVMMAAHWIASGLGGDAKALVVCTDQSRAHLHKPYEFVMGAGAVAMLISAEPKVIEYELEYNGYWTGDAYDTCRPTSKVETGNNEQSLYCYLDALEGAYAHYRRKAGEFDLDERFKKNIYHVPFGGITFQAHRTLLRQHYRMKKSEGKAHFAEHSQPGLVYNAQMGGTYSGSTFIALMGMIDTCDDLRPGDRVSIFSYGSGYSGEFYSGKILPEAKKVVAEAGLADLLARRRRMPVPEYEALETKRFSLIDTTGYEIPTDGAGGLYAERYAGQHRLKLEGNQDYLFQYGWS